MKKLYWFIILLVSNVVLHFSANSLGIYDMQIQAGSVWIDNVLHIIVGMSFAFLGLWLVENHKPTASKVQVVFWSLLTVCIAAVLWELIEYGFMEIFEEAAREFKIYSPSIGEAGMDVVSNMLGGVLVALGYGMSKK